MWIAIVIAIVIVFAGIGALVGGGLFTLIGLPIAAIIAAFFVASFLRRGSDGPQLVSKTEPTGVPRSSSAGAETANERVGQT